MNFVKKNPVQRVVLDTNVYISAILFGGTPEKIRKLSKEKKIELLVSEAIIAEVKEIFSLNIFKQPNYTKQMINLYSPDSSFSDKIHESY